ncbi:MAG TPA: recombination mediator RecR [Desulfomonilaceae bacterium]|nr:recombination mediator RecR [Desulfomonilaceae bacterium]
MAGPLETLIEALKRFPGVGEKTATRYAFYILNEGKKEIQDLINAIRDVKQKLRLCSTCYNLTDSDPCAICSDRKRERTHILVVETPLDLIAVEKSHHFYGMYHVLHGVLSPLDAIGPEDIRLAELVHRVQGGRTKEVILALNPTVEGEATASYIRDQLQGLGVKVSRIAFGIPIGSSLEYSDPLSLSSALDNRKEL